MSLSDDNEPVFELVEDDEQGDAPEDVHYDWPDEPPVGREFYDETEAN